MPPEPHSSGTTRKSRECRSTGSTKQVRFPTRRRRVRGQSNGVQKRENSSLKRGNSSLERKGPSLKQQTLTQMSFVSSFGEEVTLALTDDDASDEDRTACDKSGLTVPQRESETLLTKEPLELATREDAIIIQDSCGSTYDGSDDDDAPAGVNISPPQWPEHVQEAAAMPPRSVEWAGSLDVVRDSPRRRAHLSRNLEELESTQSSQEDGASLSAHVHFAAVEADDREIPDSDEEDNEELQLRDFSRLIHQETLYAGHETQLIMQEMASLEDPVLTPENSPNRRQPTASHNSLALTPSDGIVDGKHDFLMEDTQSQPTAIPQTPAFSLPSSQTTQVGPDDQTGFSQGHNNHHAPTHTQLPSQGQIFESQRVPLQILQSLAPVSARTDILIPTPSEVLDPIISGSEAFVHLAYRVPEEVQRFWLFSHGLLRYMACIQPGRPHGRGWDYQIDQVYQLNNALEERDMQEEGWVNGEVRRYIYLPPAIAGQLLWNLRCATFGQDRSQKDDKIEISSNHPTSSHKDPTSSATTLQSAKTSTAYIRDHDTAGQPSSLILQDYGSSTATLPANAVFGSSPLLTKSQMLSDSLISDKL
ncbi:hypothetical protein TRIATDRAFT_286171 [Trichoderma atroviride IMI 206040]|uniref:Uncharacterized protein n=1 Tax=Hypocrea atroviridis (strain ATCC 20476 / IMI 206040) TaxID=452589 RepID=G9P5L1_HYPAI|nr:uncharacterized protein TRIATDRAFT_286171 [Trichoderma atroviride IMI 206040]EHK40524.1 hypothetical protein TRIATDRAFT_286171 [Trichoderma atroviride IMI 206040]